MGNDSLAVNLALSVLVVVLMVPGLVIEPGPISELLGLAAIGTIWGVDLSGEQKRGNGNG